MAVPTFVASRSDFVVVPTAAGWTVRLPVETEEGDLLLNCVDLFNGSGGGIQLPAGWSQIPNAFENDTQLYVFARRATAADAGGATNYHFDTATGLFAPLWTTVVYRGAPDYTDAVVSFDSGTAHTVPAIVVPTADTLIVAFSVIKATGAQGSFEDTMEIDGFTQDSYFFGTTLGVFDGSYPVLATNSKPAGSSGLQGTWPMTTEHNDRMGFIVLGLLPDLPDGLHIDDVIGMW